jgi:hypothetical protein
MTAERDIWMALRQRIVALPLTVALPNTSFDLPRDEQGNFLPFVRAHHMPNRTLRPFIASNSPHHYRGMIQLDMMALLNEDVAVAVEQAGEVAAFFPADLRLTFGSASVRITSRPTVGADQAQDTHLMVPVTAEYEAYI